jgi:stage V sporulation protein R
MSLPIEITKIQDQVKILARDFGLDPFEVNFEMVDYDEISQIAARGGFPVRYPHWRFGMEYDQLSKSYTYGLSKIYEMVINTDPCTAYLLQANAIGDQKLVIAHVYGHSDFFKNNLYFSKTNRKMLDKMANHATRIRNYMDRHGVDEVETFIDVCLSLENLIDPFLPFQNPQQKDVSEPTSDPKRFESPKYMEKYINPPEILKKEQEQKAAKIKSDAHKIPENPQRDILLFLIEHAPLNSWQQDVLSIIRDEAYYFSPQAQTKIMNEGWASYWHSFLMTNYLLGPEDLIDYANNHASTLAMPPGGPLNPYKIGLELYRDIEDRWNRGCFGPEYEHCQDPDARQKWNRDVGKGREKIFEVRKIYNDITFIDNYLTEDFCRKHKLFVFAENPKNQRPEIVSREFQKIKQHMLTSLTNFGQPIIDVIDANFLNRGELLLKHRFETQEIDMQKSEATLKNLYQVWNRPVHIYTHLQDNEVRCCFDGESFEIHKQDNK